MSYVDHPHILPNLPIKNIVIFLHGYGASGHDLLSIGKSWEKFLPNTAFISPNAPEICEVNALGFQWFGLKDFSADNMRGGLDKARPILTNYLNSFLYELKLSPCDMFLVGFSQGSMMALEMLYVFANLGGIISYSGAFYPHSQETILKPSPHVLLVHGTHDKVVPYASMAYAFEELKKQDIRAQTYSCPNLEHSISIDGMNLGRDFIQYQITQQPIVL